MTGSKRASIGFSAGASTARSLADDAGSGTYPLSVGDGASGRVGDTLDFANTGKITASDSLEVLRIAVGLDPSWGPAQGLDFVVADLYDDARVTAGDALEGLRSAVVLDGHKAPKRKFVEANLDVSGVTRESVPETEDIADLTSIRETQNVDMPAILFGNMENFA